MYGGYGTMYNPMQPPKMTTGLTPEQVQELRNMKASFTLNVTPEETMMSKCYHKFNGNVDTIPNPDGSVTCRTCHATFNIEEMSNEEVRDLCDRVINVLQTIKLFNVDMPDQWSTFFTIIPLINKIPELYKISCDVARKYQNGNNFSQTNGLYGYSALNALTSPSYGMGMPMNGMPGYPMNNNMNAQYGMSGYPMSTPMNGMAMNNGMPGYPMNNGMNSQYGMAGYPMNNGMGQSNGFGFGMNNNQMQQQNVTNQQAQQNISATKMTTPDQPGEIKTTATLNV